MTVSTLLVVECGDVMKPVEVWLSEVSPEQQFAWLTAIASDGDSTYVWVVDPDLMTVSRREVTIADGIGETVVVTEGLGAGETIATAGASFLADGMQVRPWSE